jgi:2-polyprenyl-3-methyl-5-hydroxy-6-metoxy-1,4-benzoquinol methylase
MTDPASTSRSAPSTYWLEGFARRVDEAPALDEREELDKWYRTLLGPYVPPATRSVLDIGCGRGRVIRALAAIAPGCRCVGIDGNDATLAATRRELSEQRIETVLHRIDLTEHGYVPLLAERHGRFDVITSLFVLHHYPPSTAGAILRELRGLLAPTGVIVLAEAHDPNAYEAAMAEQVFALLAALAGQVPDLLWTVTELLEACRLGGFGEGEARFETAHGSPFTPAEAAANLQALDRIWTDLLEAEAQLAATAAREQLAALKRVVLKMRQHGIARPARFGPLLAILQPRSFSAQEGTN